MVSHLDIVLKQRHKRTRKWPIYVLVGKMFLIIETAFIIQGKGFIIAKTYQINKQENMNFLSPSFWFGAKNGSPALGNSLFDRCSQVGK